ncbi:MAG: IclR family transcriptional regulator [Beijerinckiaceae bacterium]|jgi:DNA-binding IclR family transcriptional regulator|nr:IclR family transcriptional regulator [Beijerinckiaceae bacterium]
MTDSDSGEAFGAQSAIRTLRLLRLLGDAGAEGASLAALVRLSGLSKPTCRRLLVALIEEGMAVQDPATRFYFLGREIYLLGMVAADRYGIHRVALDSVTRLAQKTGDAAFLQVRHGDEVVCLAREDGTFPLRSHVLKAGDRHLLGAGAGPLAILAALPEAEAEAYLASHARGLAQRYPALGPLLPTLVLESRERGYSLNRGILFPGSWGMGMAIRGPSGRIEACLSLAAVESRMQPDREPELVTLLTGEVRLVEQRLARAAAPAAPLAVSAPRRNLP